MVNVGAASTKVMATSVLAVGLLASGMTASAAPALTPRVSPAQCAQVPANTGYVVVDPVNQTTCTVQSNGTYMWVKGSPVRLGRPSAFVASFRVTNRGDLRRNFAVFRFIRGKTVIYKRVRVVRGKALAGYTFKRRGVWAVVATFQGRVVTSRVTVY